MNTRAMCCPRCRSENVVERELALLNGGRGWFTLSCQDCGNTSLPLRRASAAAQRTHASRTIRARRRAESRARAVRPQMHLERMWWV